MIWLALKAYFGILLGLAVLLLVISAAAALLASAARKGPR